MEVCCRLSFLYLWGTYVTSNGLCRYAGVILYVVCLEDYISVLLLPCSITTSALGSPSLLLSCSIIITILLHIAIILIIALMSFYRGKIGTSCGLEVKQDTQPALGLAWSHCVNTRVLLRKDSVFMHGGAYWSTSTSTSTSQDNEDQEQQHRQGQFQGQEQQSQSGFGAGSGSGRGAITTRRANRSMHLEFSPVCGARACTYKITGDGLEGETRLYG